MRRPHTRLRNVLISATIIAVFFLLTAQTLPTHTASFGLGAVAEVQARPLSAAAVELTPTSPNTGTQDTTPGKTVTYGITLRNTGTTSGTFVLSKQVSCDAQIPGCIDSFSVSSINQLDPNQSLAFQVSVTIPLNAQVGVTAPTVIRATISSEPGNPPPFVDRTLQTTIIAPTATTIPTRTPTNTPTTEPTVTPTATPAPGCPDLNDPGDDFGGAQLLLVNVPANHGICERGDVDFFKFGGGANKVYTIDILQMDAGLDLVLDLYNDRGELITSNDDFYLERATPSPVIEGTPPPAADLRPRIDSFRVPYAGLYYVRVRDTLGIGGGGRAYRIVVQGESYGPTPATINELCRDLFEEDGLPEEATLITSNELQPAHVLCPVGDADWVRFFGKAGKTYYIYTDSRPYKNRDGLNEPTSAGADTILYLFDRDGVSLITLSDDIQSDDPNLKSLDSEVRFVPTVDGFYYAQVKNIGDIGNQFIKYDLVLKLCLPGAECGRGPAPVNVATAQPTTGNTTPTTGSGTSATAAATGTAPVFEDTPPPSATTTSGSSSSLTALDTAMVNGPVNGFVDSSFQREWARADQPISEQRATRSWLWGPVGLVARSESYAQAASGMRQVQYFDKGRMEINNPTGDRNSRWFVTSGLLVKELISGRMQVGANDFVQRNAADVPIAGDANDANAPTYASFAGVVGQPTGDRTSQQARQQIDRAGQVSDYSGSQRSATRFARFVPETGHNIPQVFWTYLNTQGVVYENGRYRTTNLLDWVFTLGYPLSEPYWTRARVGGVERDVLVQVFERRVLTYSPDNTAEWQVEMGNVGRHYYMWRYGDDASS